MNDQEYFVTVKALHSRRHNEVIHKLNRGDLETWRYHTLHLRCSIIPIKLLEKLIRTTVHGFAQK